MILFSVILFTPLYAILYDIIYLKLFSGSIAGTNMEYSKFDRIYHLFKGY